MLADWKNFKPELQCRFLPEKGFENGTKINGKNIAADNYQGIPDPFYACIVDYSVHCKHL